MNKTELIGAIVEKTELTKKDVEKVVNGFLSVVQETLAADEKVQLVGFGTFELRHRKERMGRNLKTGEELVIPAARVPAFKAGKALKDAVK